MNKALGIIAFILIVALTAVGAIQFTSWLTSGLKGTVSIEGEPKLGRVVTADTSKLLGSGIITYQWMRNGQPIDNSNSASYALQTSDKDAEISVVVIRSDNRGSIISESVTAEGFVLGGRGPGGGIIFYQDMNGFTMADTNEVVYHLEAALTDQGTQLSWVNARFAFSNLAGTATALGTGRRNTAAMLAADPESPAALAAKNYNGGGLNDWFLPSQDELALLYNQRSSVNISTGFYWSSSQNSNSRAWEQNFATGATAGNAKSAPPLDPDAYYDEWNPAPSARANNVRAIRAF
ncbi:MAG: DUF1566 domain-containing protein [Treponema sp.]|nr:DUF1566 domain-containing protein [Treponema sp.]MCL2238062.1 DUF1566 domain-containing protein [Treponema sp.]